MQEAAIGRAPPLTDDIMLLHLAKEAHHIAGEPQRANAPWVRVSGIWYWVSVLAIRHPQVDQQAAVSSSSSSG